MATYTSNLNLKKPAGREHVAIGDINNNMDAIDQAYGTLNSNTAFQVGDTYIINGSQIPFRTLADKSAILFKIRLPKECASNVGSFTVSITTASTTWFTGGSLGNVQSGATADNISLTGRKTIQFSVHVPNTITEVGFGICELNASFTFTAS